MSTPLVDPLDVLARAPPGMTLHSRNQIKPGEWEISWLLREESRRIRALPERVEVEVRAGLYREETRGRPVLLIPVVLRVGPMREENLWESWINARQPEAPDPLDDLRRQDRIVLQFYGDRMTRERSIAVSNSLKDFAVAASAEVVKVPAWSMADFDAAREVLYRRFPDITALWQHMGTAAR